MFLLNISVLMQFCHINLKNRPCETVRPLFTSPEADEAAEGNRINVVRSSDKESYATQLCLSAK